VAGVFSQRNVGLEVNLPLSLSLQDGFERVNSLGDTIKGRLQVSFVDVHGMPEAGVDGGGLFKDFVENLVKEGFDPALGLFLETSDNRLYPNPSAGVAMDSAIPAMEFLGKMLGKTLYEVGYSVAGSQPCRSRG